MASRPRKSSPKTSAPKRPAPKLPAAPRAEIEGLRGRIDAVDRDLHALLNERARLARAVGISKGKEGRLVDFYRPERESQVLRMALERNAAARGQGALRDEEIVRLFREIMSACLAQEEPLKVGFLGPEGTFSQAAVYKHFGHSARALALGSIDEVFREVEAGHADFGVVPIENSTEGSVNHTLDRFLSSPLRICGEVELRIRQNLMGRMRSLREVKRVCSHPQSLAQCREWLNEHLPDAERIPESSNAEAARRRSPAPRRPRSMASKCSPPTSRIGRTTPRASWSSDTAVSGRAARTAPRCCSRPATPRRRARCIGCSSRWRATA